MLKTSATNFFGLGENFEENDVDHRACGNSWNVCKKKYVILLLIRLLQCINMLQFNELDRLDIQFCPDSCYLSKAYTLLFYQIEP